MDSDTAPTLPQQDLDIVALQKPKRGSSYLTSSYYRNEHAARIKSVLDKALAEKKDQLIRYDKVKMSAKTLKTFVEHSWAYLIDWLDTPEFLYKELREKMKICPEHNGVAIRFKMFQGDSILDSVESVEPSEEFIESQTPWKKELKLFLQEASVGDSFSKDKLNLSEDDRSWIQGIMAGVAEDFIYKVDDQGSYILIVKEK